MPSSISVAIVLLCLTLAACGGSGSGSSGGAVDPPEQPSISFDPAKAIVTSDRASPRITSTLQLALHDVGERPLYIFGSHTRAATTEVRVGLVDATGIYLGIFHRPVQTLFNGTYTDRLKFTACLDQACNRQLDGSPLDITITYTVTGTDPETGLTGPPPDPEATALEVQSRVALPHDVRDAEYSRSLDRIVMVATYPGNALYVYDVATGSEESVPLAEEPTAVSISPDGLTAAVGHDGLISIVDLTQVGQPSAPVPLLLNVTIGVFDLVLDGVGRVHAIPDTDDDWTSIYTIDIATDSEQRSTDPGFYGRTYARLHPSGNFLFAGDPLSSSDLEKWDITGPAAKRVATARFSHAYIGACGELWFDESGARVYSQCGQAFGTDSPSGGDLPWIGRLELSGPELTTDAYTIAWMDRFEPRSEIALVEANQSWCNAPDYTIVCYSRFGIFDSDLFTRRSMHALEPITVDGTLYGQRGLFVFYQTDGSRKFLLSWLDAMSDPVAKYYLSVLD